MFTPLHKHILIKTTIRKPFTTESSAKKFLTDLVELIGMVPVTEPQAVYVAEEGNKGFTGSINLATSHIAFHIWDETGLLMMDLYSCKDFPTTVVIDFVDHKLDVSSHIDLITIDRETMITQREVL